MSGKIAANWRGTSLIGSSTCASRMRLFTGTLDFTRSSKAGSIVGTLPFSPSSRSDSEPYTLHKNPVFVATKAIYLTLTRQWERLGEQADRVPQKLAVGFLASLHRGEEQYVSRRQFGKTFTQRSR